MPVSERAKQFSPFMAIGELEPALKRIEADKKEAKIEIGNERASEINDKLNSIKPGYHAICIYHNGLRYVRESGYVKKIDLVFRTIEIGEKMIFFDDILEISFSADDKKSPLALTDFD